MQPVEEAGIRASGNRVEYRRGDMTEWYVNDERGLDQGFTLNAPPASRKENPGPWIALSLDLYGDTKATLNSSANRVDFATLGGVGFIRFCKLRALDAAGKDLPARFTLAGGVLHIQVDTGGAIDGSGANVAFNPPDSDPHPCPYRIQVEVTSSVSGLSDAEVIDITVHLAGDANGSGRVDILDKRVVRDQYGNAGCACP